MSNRHVRGPIHAKINLYHPAETKGTDGDNRDHRVLRGLGQRNMFGSRPGESPKPKKSGRLFLRADGEERSSKVPGTCMTVCRAGD